MIVTNNYDMNPINHANIYAARERFNLTDMVVLTFEPGDATRYRVVLMHNGADDNQSLTIERHESYGALYAQATVLIGAPHNDKDRLTSTDMEPLANNNVHTAHMLAALINNFLDR